MQEGLQKLSTAAVPEGGPQPMTHMNGGEEAARVQGAVPSAASGGDEVEQEDEVAAIKEQQPEEPAPEDPDASVAAQEPAAEAAE